MKKLPFNVRFELEGWTLFWAFLSAEGEAGSELAALRSEVAEAARDRYPTAAEITAFPPVGAMRRLFKAAGCDPTRYRPASEALLRRLVKGADLPSIHPLVDVNNCLSAQLAVPCCVMAEGSFGRTLSFRVGRPGESYVSLRGPFKLDSKPVLFDEDGPLDAPITGNEKVMVRPETERAWLVAYLPSSEVTPDHAWQTLEALASRSGVAAERYPAATP